MDNINTFLQHAVEIGASDLFIAAGKAPAFRVNGEVVTDSTLPALTDDELTAFRQSRSGAAARRSVSPPSGRTATPRRRNARRARSGGIGAMKSRPPPPRRNGSPRA